MSKSIIIKKNGGPEVLELQDVNVGSPGPDEIKVTNHAIGLNYIDTYHRSGLYPLALPSGIGLEAAGKVDEVGSNVKEFNKGDNIEYAPSGIEAYAMLSPLLNSVTFEPTSSILPAASKPIPLGNVRGYNPDL